MDDRLVPRQPRDTDVQKTAEEQSEEGKARVRRGRCRITEEYTVSATRYVKSGSGSPDLSYYRLKTLRKSIGWGGSSEVDVHAHRFNQHRAAILVVAGVVDVLEIERVIDAAPGVQVVVALQNVFAGVVQFAVAEEKAEAAELQVVLMIFFDGVGDEGQAELVVGARPRAAGVVAAERDGLVDLGVGVGLVLAFVPADAGEDAADFR